MNILARVYSAAQRRSIWVLGSMLLYSDVTLAACVSKDRFILRSFFQSADVQYETDKQRKTISDALLLLARRPKTLHNALFEDYGGTAKRWTFIQVIDHYFLPSASTFLKGVSPQARMIAAASCPEVKEAILDRVRNLPKP